MKIEANGIDFDRSATGMSITGLDGRLRQVNGEFCRMVGYAPDELVGRHVSELTHPADLDLTSSGLREMVQGTRDRLTLTKRYLRRDGQTVWGRLFVSAVRDDRGAPRYFLSQIIDVTDQKHAEQALRESGESLAMTQRIAGLGSWEWDIATDTVKWSDEMYDIHGLTREQFANRVEDYPRLVHAEDLQAVQDVIQHLMDGGEPGPFEYRIIRPDGEVRDVYGTNMLVTDVAGRPVSVVGTVQDITDRRRRERMLEEARNREALVADIRLHLHEATTADEVIAHTVRGLHAALPFGRSAFSAIVGEQIRVSVSEGPPDMPAIGGLAADMGRAPMYLAALQAGETVAVGDVTEDERVAPLAATLAEGGTRALVDVPIRYRQDAIGLLCIDAPGARVWSAHEVALVEAAARALETAIREVEADARAERARARAQLYLDAVDVMIVGLDARGCVTLINPAGARLMEWDPGDLTGRDWFASCLRPDDEPIVRRAFGRLIAGEVEALARYENRVVTRSGRELLIAWQNTLLRDEAGQPTGTLSAGTDITERRQAQQALQSSERRYATLAERAPVGIFHAEADGAGGWVNPRMCEIMGLTPDQAVGDGWARALHPDDAPAVGAAWAAFVTGTAPYDMSYRFVRPDGDVRHVVGQAGREVSSDGTVTGFTGTVTDITDYVLANEQLAASQRFITEVTESVADAVFAVRMPDRVIEFVNGAVAPVLGYQPEEVVGKTTRLFYSSEAAFRSYEARLRRVGTRGGGEFRTEQELVRKDGTRVWAEIATTSIMVDGVVTRLFSVVRDITARKTAEAEVLASRDQLQQLAAGLEQAREAERTRIAREIHDDLGQAFTSLKLDVAWIERRLGAAEIDVRRRAGAMRELIDTAAHTLRRVQTELRPGVLDDLGLTAAIQWVARDFRERTGIGTTVRNPEAADHVTGDRATAVFRVLQEALTNVARHAGATTVDIALSMRNDTFKMTVRDNGTGIARGATARPRSFGVLGIKERARTWGGSAAVSRHQGGGTQVMLTLPTAEAEPV